MNAYSILYRGPLSSCNYACEYCPFGKTKNTRDELLEDAKKLKMFIKWIEENDTKSFGILFTPWGEALIRRHYQLAFVALSRLANVTKVSAQTNLSGGLDWLEETVKEKVALWTTFHPSQVPEEKFLKKTEVLIEKKIHFSVGMVGMQEDFESIIYLRKNLSSSIYLWINAYKREANYYSKSDISFLKSIDPNFEINNTIHPSFGQKCRAGSQSFTVDGEGDVRRCHFIPKKIGNIFEDDIFQKMKPSNCTIKCCRCHIGSVYLDYLKQHEIYGDGILERIPRSYLA